jgi:anti-anti-sigma factor
MPTERHFIFPGVLEKVPEACEFVAKEAEKAGLDERAVYHCQMAVDEWCTNIVTHGCCGDDEDQSQIEVSCLTRLNQFIITITDNGIAFDPTTLAEVDPKKPLEEREPGGLGWFFIRKFMDQVSYDYRDRHNYLTMVKYGARYKAKGETITENVFPAHELQDGIWVVMPDGRLDSSTARTLEQTLVTHQDAAHVRLIVDMSSVAYISSSGLKVLVSAWRKAQKLGGQLVLARLNDRVREVFAVSGFDTLFTITPSIEEAAARIT